MSKGSRPRPIKDRKKFDDNWDSIFGKRKIKRALAPSVRFGLGAPNFKPG